MNTPRILTRRLRDVLILLACLLYILAWFYFAFIAKGAPDLSLSRHEAKQRAAAAERMGGAR